MNLPLRDTHIYLTENDYQVLWDLAEEQTTSISQIIRQLIRKEKTKKEKEVKNKNDK